MRAHFRFFRHCWGSRTSIVLIFAGISQAVFGQHSGSDYRSAEGFDGFHPAGASINAFHPIGTAGHIVTGTFDALDGEPVGPAVLLTPDGKYEARFDALPMYDAEFMFSTQLHEGGFQLLLRDSHLTRKRYLVRLDRTGALLRAHEIEGMHVAGLTPDGAVLVRESEYIAIEGRSEHFVIIAKVRIGDEGVAEIVEDFERIIVATPDLDAIHVHRDGSLLLGGAFTRVGTENPMQGRILKFDSLGRRDIAFRPDGVPEDFASLENIDFQSLANGDIFVFSEEHGPDLVFRLNQDGTPDKSFSLDESLLINGPTRISPATEGRYFLHQRTPLRLTPTGKIDATFAFDPVDAGFEAGTALVSAALSNGSLFITDQFDNGSRRAALVSPTGAVRETSPGALESSRAIATGWTPSGELWFMIDNAWQAGGRLLPGYWGVSRLDGSLRFRVNESPSELMFPTFDGGLASQAGAIYDRYGLVRRDVGLPPRHRRHRQMKDGRWIAVAELADNRGEVVLLLPSGARDPAFIPYSVASVHDVHVWPVDEGYFVASRASAHTAESILTFVLGNGTPDATFATKRLSSPPSQVLQTKTHVYVSPGTSDYGAPHVFTIDGIAKPFGARLSPSGQLDPAYRPEDYLKQRAGGTANSASARLAEDGSSIHLAIPYDEPFVDAPSLVWHISPNGLPTVVEEAGEWMSARLEVAPDGKFAISGEVAMTTGKVAATGLFTPHAEDASVEGALQVINPGETATVAATVLGTDRFEDLAWVRNGTRLDGAFSLEIDIPGLQTDETAEIELWSTTSGASRVLARVAITTPQIPAVHADPTPRSIEHGKPVALEVYAYGGPDATIQWFRDGEPIDGANGRILEIGGDSMADIGSYRARIRNSVGEVWSDSAGIRSSGPWPIQQLTFLAGSKVGYGILGAYPAPENKIRLVTDSFYFSRDRRVDLLHADGSTAKERILDDLDLDGTSQYARFVHGSDRIYLVRSLRFRENSNSVRRYWVRRLNPDDSFDEAFGEHIIDDVGNTHFELGENEDGDVILQTSSAALSIAASGSSDPIPIPNSPAKNQYSLTDKWNTALADGSKLIRNVENGDFHVMATDGVVQEISPMHASVVEKGRQLLGVWRSGTALYVDDSGTILSAKNIAGEWIWETSLGDARLALAPPASEPAARDAAGSRIFLLGQRDSSPDHSFIIYVEEDAGPSFAETKVAVPRQDRPAAIWWLPNDLIVTTFETGSDSFGSKHGYSVIDFNRESAATYVPTYLQRSNPTFLFNSHGQLGFIVHQGSLVNGVETGPIARLTPNGQLDHSFEAPDIPSEELDASRFLARADGGLAWLLKTDAGDAFRLIASDGSVSSIDTVPVAPGHYPFFKEDSDGRVVIVWWSEKGVHLNRYLNDGTPDISFGINNPLSPGELYDVALTQDSSIYLLIAHPEKGRIVLRAPLDGASQPIEFYQEIEDLRLIAASPGNELIVVDEAMKRFDSQGQLLQTYPGLRPFQLSVLSNGDLYVAGEILRKEDASLRHSIAETSGWNGIGVVNGRLIQTKSQSDGSVTLTSLALSGPEQIIAMPRSQNARMNDSVALSVVLAEPNAFTEARWYKDGNLIEGIDRPVLALADLTATDFGTYRVELISPEGSIFLPEIDLVQKVGNTETRLEYLPSHEGLQLKWDKQADLNLQWSKDLIRWEWFGGPRRFHGNEVDLLFDPASTSLPAFFRLDVN